MYKVKKKCDKCILIIFYLKLCLDTFFFFGIFFVKVLVIVHNILYKYDKKQKENESVEKMKKFRSGSYQPNY
jgi:hypothetical protein